MWKNSVITASDIIFPGLAYHDREKEFWDMDHLIKSSLSLQMALYTNVWAFPIWLVISGIDMSTKYCQLNDLYKFITITISLVFGTLEFIRLYFGYLGNLAEKIPELAGFWLISTLVQLPLAIFLFFDDNTLPSQLERTAQGIMIILLLVEITTGTMILKIIADHHAKRFNTARIYGIDMTLR